MGIFVLDRWLLTKGFAHGGLFDCFSMIWFCLFFFFVWATMYTVSDGVTTVCIAGA